MANSCPRCRADNPETQRFCGECGTPLPSGAMTETLRTPVHELATGTTFAGRYQIIEELGKGGMGRVYKVFDTKINEKVALKLIKPEIAFDRETLERFSNEMKLARKIGHRNVCRMFDLGEAEGLHFLTMEYVSGEDLKSMVRMSGTLSIGAVLSIGRQVADGLAEAHRLGVIHRDLKPQNVMIDKGGNAKIMDFGIARSIREKGITGPSVMIGTPEYMSPEQAEAKEIDERSDIYSLGIILYEMVTGRVPFEGDTALSIAMKHKGEKPKDPKEFNPAIPEDLTGVILKCIEKSPEKRHASATEVRDALTKIEKGLPTTERIAPKPKANTSREITVKFRPKQIVIPVLAIILLLGALIVLFQVIPGKRVERGSSGIPSLAILYFKNNTGDPKMDFWRSALAESLITDMSQSKYIRVLSWDEVYETLKELSLLEARGYTTEDLKKVAENGQAEYVLQGSLSRAGDKFRIETTIRQVGSGKISVPETTRVEGTGEQSIYTMIDELTKKTKESLRLTQEQIAGDIDYEIGKVTTNSPEALRYFTQAFELQKLAKYSESYPLLKKAIEIDPGFAMAYWGMGMGNPGLSASEHRMYREKARALSSKLPDRERWRIEALYYYSEQTMEQKVDAFSHILALYPWDMDAANDLGIVYYGIYENVGKAIETYENIYAYYPIVRSVLFLGNLSAFYCQAGEFEKSDRLLNDYLNNVGENSNIRLYLGNSYFHQGRNDLAFAEANKALLLDPPSREAAFLRGRVFMAKDQYPDAEKEYMKNRGIEDPSFSLRARRLLAILYAQQGRFIKSRSILEEAMKPGQEYAIMPDSSPAATLYLPPLAYVYLSSHEYDKANGVLDKLISISLQSDDLTLQRTGVWLKGLAYVGEGSLAEAERTATELTRLIGQSQNKNQANRLFNHLRGCIELEEENLPKAIEHLENAKSLLTMRRGVGYADAHPIFLSALGEAYFNSGLFEKARAEYEAVSRVIYDKVFCGDLWAKSFYWLGKIAEKQGKKSEAIAHYKRFLDLWKDADPVQPEVEDARARLRAL